ncbi:hypothetical protein PRZ48_008935 [Zasmidium cellare]|uniref:Uncharacterized protein n=1 Tax=Zasmidium cellare TaxID=395010 RepID=A0ABR0EHX2_ZASCE|nr:hypothetical protein PRZ48_008935 [Zasmidium cellare]
MVQNSDPSGNGLNPGAWAGVGLGAAGCIFVFCMWVFRWSKRSRDNIVRGEDAVGRMKKAFGIGKEQKRRQRQYHAGKPRFETKGVWEGRDEELGVVKVPSPVAKGP